MGHRMTRPIKRCLGALALVVAAFGFIVAAQAQGYSPTGTCPAHQWNYAYGSMTTAADCLQPSFGDLSGTFSNAQLPVGTANTVKGSVNGTSETDLSVPSCSSSGSVLQWTSGSGFGCATSGGSSLLVPPQGRLTLASHTPVLTANTTAQSTIYYDAYKGNEVPVYNGTADVMLTIGSNEISDALPSSGTGDVLSGGVFDEWAVSVSGTLTLCHATNGSGGGWASDTGGSSTARGTGYSALDNHTRSYLTNKNAIADCYNGSTNEGSIAANEATYLGSFYTTANGQTGVSFGGSASGGTAGFFYLWNDYNRVHGSMRVIDTGADYTYSSSTIRQARASAGNQGSFVLGVAEDSVSASYNAETAGGGSNPHMLFGLGLDSTTAFSGQPAALYSTVPLGLSVGGTFNASGGIHTIAALEQSDGVNGNAFNFSSLNELDVTVEY